MADITPEIIERVLAGDLGQYREVVRAYEADVFRVAAPVLGSRAAAEDVTQDVFITAYRRLESFDRSQPFRPWLLGIARNLVRNELRRRSREDARVELYSRYIDSMTVANRSDERERQVAAALASCREGLAAAAQTAIRGRYDDGLSLELLADRMQRSITATRQLLYRARLTLRDCIESRLRAQGAES